MFYSCLSEKCFLVLFAQEISTGNLFHAGCPAFAYFYSSKVIYYFSDHDLSNLREIFLF